MTIPDCLVAAHVLEVKQGGKDIPSNGIVLCGIHHPLFDNHRFGVRPHDRSIIVPENNPYSREELWITRARICEPVSDAAILKRWEQFRNAVICRGGVLPDS